MAKRKLILAFVSILCISLLFNGILYLEWDKAKKETDVLEGQVTTLTADKERLNKTVAELEGTIAYPEQNETAANVNWRHSMWWQTAMLQGDSDKTAAFDKRVNENPIDAYFAGQKEPVTTVDFVEYYYLYQNAWKEEMNAVYAKLLLLVKEPELQKKLADAQAAFQSSLQANYDFVVVAFGAEGLYQHYGTNVWLLDAGLAQGYKERTIELLEWSYLLDENSNFTFSPADFERKYDPSDIREQPQGQQSQTLPQIQTPLVPNKAVPGEQNGTASRPIGE